MLGSSLHQLGNLTQLMPTPDGTTKSQHIFTIAVEGNIGCGKTTFLQHFKGNPKVEVLPEPVDKWKSVKGYNSLDMMYKDAARWSLAFQSYVTLTMMEHHENKEETPKVKMIERSIYSTRHCFIENLHQGGLMPDIDYNILGEWHDWLNQNSTTDINLIVYLRASPQNCFDRIHKRNRDEEKDVPIEYLNSLHKLHEDWLIEKKRGELPAPLLVIDANLDLEDLQKKISQMEPKILSGNLS
ncbi:thymidine kinase 2, mitochondrial-like [Haliotis rufescens]|uniref:thymidine kinase 2, mitochondrial-like n=1 Tax=Haliotis rufescens TaxID=6454 RepID=UPI001EB02141|nr:thymidine kinase 2, mitochondrial-like [Haliotis rufescens]